MSRFVSGGTDEQPIERDDAWLKAQQEIEAKRRQKEEESRQEGGKSLYDTLQANKAAKQDAFEEAARLSNQFRSLDEDEVEFLDAVLESTRAKESAVRKETAEQLDLFRRQQEETEKAARLAAAGDEQSNSNETETWAVKKRKRGREKESFVGVKLRKPSSAHSPSVKETNSKPPPQEIPPDPVPTPKSVELKATQLPPPELDEAVSKAARSPTPTVEKSTPTTVSLGLAGYSSDED